MWNLGIGTAGALALAMLPGSCGRAGDAPSVPHHVQRDDRVALGELLHHGDCDEGCDGHKDHGECDGHKLGAPRLVAPLATAITTSQRPTLRWALADGTQGAQVEICADRACADVQQTFAVRGTEGRPPDDLAPGVHFWRLRGTSDDRVGTEVSPPWEFFVGHGCADQDTSWGTIPDFNADGAPDFAAGAPFSGLDVLPPGPRVGRAFVYLNTGSGLPEMPSETLENPALQGGLGRAVASAGDLDGDGYVELAVAATSTVYVFEGGPSGVGTDPIASFAGATRAASAGDVNRDGYADLVVSGGGQVRVFLGSASGVGSTPAATLTGDDGIGAGDVNGDGYNDVATRTGSVVALYTGSAQGLPASPTSTFDAGAGVSLVSLADAGDLNGDGRTDLVAGAPRSFEVFVLLGSDKGLPCTASMVLADPNPRDDAFGFSLATAGDVNGDGFDDLVVGTGNGDALTATRAYVYLGGQGGVPAAPNTTIARPVLVRFGFAVGGTGDLDGDGFDDLAVGSIGTSDFFSGDVEIFAGSAAGVVQPQAQTLEAGGLNGNFGWSLAGIN